MNTKKSHAAALVVVACVALARPAPAGPEHDHKHGDHDDTVTPATAPDKHDEHAHGQEDAHAHGDAHVHGDAHADEVTLPADAIRQNGVRVGAARMQVLTDSFVAPARVAFDADAMAHVGSAVTGRVAELKVKLGDNVSKGDVLAVIDSPELGEAQSDLLMKRTTADAALPSVALAKAAYDRAKQLLDEHQGVALAEVQKREADFRTAEGAWRVAGAAATAAETRLRLYGMSQENIDALLNSGKIVAQYHVLAPTSGQIVEREVTLGELVRPDRDALLVIADLSTMWVVADVPESRLGDVGKGSVACVRTDTRTRDAMPEGKSFDGTVTYIAPALDPQTRSGKVRIEVKDDAGTLRVGMFVRALISPAQSDTIAGVLCVPEEAVQTVEGTPAVFVPVDGEPNTFAKRVVTVGPVTAGMVQVLSGLKDGEPVVTSGSFILKAELGKAGAAHEH